MDAVQTIVPSTFDCPNGTISVDIVGTPVMAGASPMMRLVTVTDVDPYDWSIILEVLKRFNVTDPVIDGPYWDGDVDIWYIPLADPA
jgi:hypothetical protein